MKRNMVPAMLLIAIGMLLEGVFLFTKDAFATDLVEYANGVRFDAAYYAAQNQDVVELIQKGEITSCKEHFLTYGFKEGRLPYENAADTTPQKVVELTNVTRKNNGVAELSVDDKLHKIAQIRADEIATAGIPSGFSHTRPNGQPWYSVYDEQGYTSELETENLEWNVYGSSAQAAIDMWMASPTHKQNIIDPSVTKIGVAVALTTDGKVVIVQEFAK